MRKTKDLDSLLDAPLWVVLGAALATTFGITGALMALSGESFGLWAGVCVAVLLILIVGCGSTALLIYGYTLMAKKALLDPEAPERISTKGR